MSIDASRIFKHFEGMEDVRAEQKKRADIIESQKDVYNPEYVKQERQKAKDAILQDKQERAAKAKQEIENIKEELTTVQYKDPYENIEGNVITKEDKILVQLERMNNMQVYQAKLKAASSKEELESLYKENKTDKDFMTLFDPELKTRANDPDKGTDYRMFQSELKQDPPEFQELKKLESTVTFFGNMEKFPKGIEKGDYSNIEYLPLI